MKNFQIIRLLFKIFFCSILLTSNLANAVSSNNYAQVWKDHKGAVASVNPIATQAGIDAFEEGGNAIDAALAVAFTLGVVDSHNSGIGGGLFILVRYPDGSIEAIDGREMAPSAATRDMYIRNGKAVSSLSKTGALAIGVPGSIAAMHYLQKKAGDLHFSDVILPAADIAEKGFPVDAVMAKRLTRTQDSLGKFPATKKVFFNNAEVFKKGEVLKQKDLAKTYRKLAKQGPDYFYKGEFAKKLEKWMKKNNGIVTREDFVNYEFKIREPVKSSFMGYDIFGFPPPSSGGVHVAQILNILENFDLTKLNETDRYHVLIESMKLAFADRAFWLGDSDFVDVPKGLAYKEYASELAKKIRMNKALDLKGHSIPPQAEEDIFKHTTHISTADDKGNWVAITTTLNTSFGSKVTIPGTGVLMNNQMDDFSSQPGVANAFGLVGAEANSIAPKKRPLSSMSPTIVLKNGKPVLTVGAAGGPTIISQVLQAIVNHLAFSQPVEKALETVRVHNQWKPDMVFIDLFATDSLWQSLEGKGHKLRKWPPFGATQAIGYSDGKFFPVTEPRLTSGNR